MKKYFGIILTFAVLACSSLLLPAPVTAHPQPLVVTEVIGNYFNDSVQVQIRVHIDPVVTDTVYPQIDTNNNGEISESEMDALSNELLGKHIVSRFNNRDAVLKKTGYALLKKNEITSLEDSVGIDYVIENPVIREVNSFYIKYDKKFMADDSYGDLIVFMDNIGENPDKLERIATNQDTSVAPVDYLVDYKILNYSQSSTPQATTSTAVKSPGIGQRFSNFISSISQKSTDLTNQARNYNFKEGGVKLFLLSLVITFIAGALHAITPGHGKSLMAAFLIGKQESKFLDVVILGLSITFAHTFVIYVIGFALWSLKMTSSAPQVTYYIEKFSSVLLIFLAIFLIRNAYRSYMHYKSHLNHGEDPHHVHHDHDDNDHHHDHHHHHDHEHNDELVHDHGFGPHSHHPGKVKIRNRWDLFYAGISGGIVPCLDALSILFVAVNIGKVGIGLLLIFFFSLGLAAAIIAIGLLLIYGRDKLNIEKKFGPLAQFYAPMISGVVILVIATIYLFKK
jgi:ABC-type nickel/cobalt efflux system permease component RcnA